MKLNHSGTAIQTGKEAVCFIGEASVPLWFQNAQK